MFSLLLSLVELGGMLDVLSVGCKLTEPLGVCGVVLDITLEVVVLSFEVVSIDEADISDDDVTLSGGSVDD